MDTQTTLNVRLRKERKESEREEKTEDSWTLFLPSTQQPIADIKQVDFCPSLRKQFSGVIRVLGAVSLELHNKTEILIGKTSAEIQITARLIK